MITVFIAPLGSAPEQYNVKPSDNVSVLKAMIFENKGLDGRDYELIYREKRFDDYVPLDAYYLEDGSKIHLVLKTETTNLNWF